MVTRSLPLIALFLILVASGAGAQDTPRFPVLPLEVLPLDPSKTTVKITGGLEKAIWLRGTLLFDEAKPRNSSLSLSFENAGGDHPPALLVVRTRSWTPKNDQIQIQGSATWAPSGSASPVESKDLRGTLRLVEEGVSEGVRTVRLQGTLRGTVRLGAGADLYEPLILDLDLLGNYRWLGEPPFTETSVGRLVLDTYEDRGIEAALEAFETAEEQHTDLYDFSERELDLAAWAVLERGDARSSLRILDRYADMYPKSALLQERYGEAFLVFGNRDRARRHLEEALSLDPGNTNALELIRFLRSRR